MKLWAVSMVRNEADVIEAFVRHNLAFVGLSLYQMYFALPRSGGAGAKPERVAGARIFVVPNPSGLNANFPGSTASLDASGNLVMQFHGTVGSLATSATGNLHLFGSGRYQLFI